MTFIAAAAPAHVLYLFTLHLCIDSLTQLVGVRIAKNVGCLRLQATEDAHGEASTRVACRLGCPTTVLTDVNNNTTMERPTRTNASMGSSYNVSNVATPSVLGNKLPRSPTWKVAHSPSSGRAYSLPNGSFVAASACTVEAEMWPSS